MPLPCGRRRPAVPRTVALIVVLAVALLGVQTCRADAIGELVDQVSAERLEGHIRALGYPRYSPASLARATGYISQALDSYGYAVFLEPVSYSSNIVARVNGSVDPDQVVVVGAHFDTVVLTPGADDNASGVAALLEMARILAPTRPPFTVEFVAFTLEEAYMVGSYAYVRAAMEQGRHITGMICFDMIGYTCASPGCQEPIQNLPGCFTADPPGVNVGDWPDAAVALP